MVGWWKIIFSLFLITGVVLCTQPPVIFSSNTHHHHSYHGHHHDQHHDVREELHFAEDTNVTVTSAEDLKSSSNYINETSEATDIAESTIITQDDGNGYFIGVLLALGAAISGSASNVIVAKVEEVSSTSLCTYSGLGGIILALIYGTILDTEDVILTNITMVSANEWLILLRNHQCGGLRCRGLVPLMLDKYSWSQMTRNTVKSGPINCKQTELFILYSSNLFIKVCNDRNTVMYLG